MVQWVKCLQCKPDDPSSNLKNPCKAWCTASTCNPSEPWMGNERKIRESQCVQSQSLAHAIASKRDPAYNKVEGENGHYRLGSRRVTFLSLPKDTWGRLGELNPTQREIITKAVVKMSLVASLSGCPDPRKGQAGGISQWLSKALHLMGEKSTTFSVCICYEAHSHFFPLYTFFYLHVHFSLFLCPSYQPTELIAPVLG